jgi:hypothetical protein
VPEGHVVRKDDRLYYAFYASGENGKFEGTLELRGLEERSYPDGLRQWRDLGIVQARRLRSMPHSKGRC